MMGDQTVLVYSSIGRVVRAFTIFSVGFARLMSFLCVVRMLV